MDSMLDEIANVRLNNLHINTNTVSSSRSLLAYIGAMQAQDYDMVKWAVGLRMINGMHEAIEQDINDAQLIRTHLLRPTWHLVASDNYRWILDLCAPHLKRNVLNYSRAVGLDESTLKKSSKLIEKLLTKHEYLSRDEIARELQQRRIHTDTYLMSHIMFHTEVQGLVCNGPRKGKQFTYALLDQRVPISTSMQRDEALARLALIYFTSHGPATERDFSWWSGLALKDVRLAIQLISASLNSIIVNDQTFLFTNEVRWISQPNDQIYCLPAFDEYLVGYADRTASLDASHTRKIITVNGIFKPVLVCNGKVIGYWKRTPKGNQVVIEFTTFNKSSKEMKERIEASFKLFQSYLDVPLLKLLPGYGIN